MMADIDKQEDLIGFCGAYCGECGMYKGRIYAKVAKDFLEILKASDARARFHSGILTRSFLQKR